MKSNNLLLMQHITKCFPGVVALNDVSIDLKKGEILSICGENGAGKSTLMKILSGDYEYGSYSGDIYVNGEIQKINSTCYAEKIGIAMIYQEINVELDLSVTENIMLGIMPKTKFGIIDWKRARQIAVEGLKRLHVDLDPETNMRNLSASVQQLVCIARALVRNPEILILDEPTAALTETETRDLFTILHQLKDFGISCIYISHKLDEVFQISDRIIVMRDSRVISEFLHDQILPEKIIEDMIGRRMDALYPSMENRIIGKEILRIENFKIQHPHSGEKEIIKNVSLSVRKGEVVGLVGLVGSGRSELLRAIYGALPKKTGRVFLEGVEVTINNSTEAIKKGIGLLTEDRKKDGIVGTMNIKENMTLSILEKISKMSFIKKREEQLKVDAFFTEINIKAPSSKTNILHLSGGNQQKVVLAKSLMTDMKVLFLDEPTRGIDIGAKSEIYKIIADLASKGLSIIMISSEYQELIAMCDRFIVIGNGEVVAELGKREADEATFIRLASCV